MYYTENDLRHVPLELTSAMLDLMQNTIQTATRRTLGAVYQ